jgi:hypothetical protein
MVGAEQALLSLARTLRMQLVVVRPSLPRGTREGKASPPLLRLRRRTHLGNFLMSCAFMPQTGNTFQYPNYCRLSMLQWGIAEMGLA